MNTQFEDAVRVIPRFRIGRYRVNYIEGGHGGFYVDVIDTWWYISFPTAKMALDWIRWDAFRKGPPSNVPAAIGRWFITKYRTQIRANAGSSAHATLNMKKQGVPLEFRQYIFEGAWT